LASQSVKTTAVPGARGFDKAKLINGRKRHLFVDTLGLLLAVVVTAASVQDRDGARLLLSHFGGACKRLRLIWVDGGSRGQLLDWVAKHSGFGRESYCGQTSRKTSPCCLGTGWLSAPSLGSTIIADLARTTKARNRVAKLSCISL
jgi:hypothetical protein